MMGLRYPPITRGPWLDLRSLEPDASPWTRPNSEFSGVNVLVTKLFSPRWCSGLLAE